MKVIKLPTGSGVYLSIIAGLSASLSSVFGKLAMDSHIMRLWVVTIAPWLQHTLPTSQFDLLIFALRGVSFVMIFLTNIIMINLFVRSMNLSTTTEAVVVNTASNFFFTAFFGWLLFGELLPGRWWMGATMILTGVMVIVRYSKSPVKPTAEQAKVKKE